MRLLQIGIVLGSVILLSAYLGPGWLVPKFASSALPGRLDTSGSTGTVPPGYSILGPTATPPQGYAFTGSRVHDQGQSWTVLPPMQTGRYNFALVPVNGKLYAIGGSGPSGCLSVTEEYDPATGTWATKAPMPTPRCILSAAESNGKIYVIGGITTGQLPGNVLSTNEEYDPATDSWTARALMPTPRYYMPVLSVNGKIHVIGGTDWVTQHLRVNEEYDPVTDSWSTKAPMPVGRQLHAGAVTGGILYLIGGDKPLQEPTGANDAYDTATNSWASKAPMGLPRQIPGAVEANGLIYVIGGTNPAAGISTPAFDVVEVYDPTLNQWNAGPSMPIRSSGLGAARVGDDIYAMGGCFAPGDCWMNVNERFSTVPTTAYYVHRKV